jgi:hypothetical protein
MRYGSFRTVLIDIGEGFIGMTHRIMDPIYDEDIDWDQAHFIAYEKEKIFMKVMRHFTHCVNTLEKLRMRVKRESLVELSNTIKRAIAESCSFNDMDKNMPFLWEPTLNDRAARLWFNEINRLMFYVTQITADIQDIVTAVQPREGDTILMIDSRIKALLVRRREQLLSNRAKLTVLVSRQTDFEPSQFVPKEGPTSRFLNQQQVNRIVASEAGVQQWYQIGLSLLSATTGRMFLKSDHNSLNGYGAQVKNMLRYLLGVDTCPSFPQEREPESNVQSLTGSSLVFFENRNEAVAYARNIETGAVRQSVSR